MAPVALHSQDNGLARNANGKNTSTVAAAPPAEPQTQPKGTPSDLSSADVIRLEHEFGAHK
jgi:hypothetical protein